MSLPALATFHLMKVVEIFPGTAASPSAQYVVIQMYASGQNLVGGHALTVFNGAGAVVGTFTFTGNVANGANQAKILIATSQAETFFGINADLVMSASMLSSGGKVCWAGTIDCVAWGAYTGSSAGVGTPFNAGGGLTCGRAAARRLNLSGSSTVLDAGDDTDNSANDFAFATPVPRNNAGAMGTVPPATCGDGAIEGLEQCDDYNHMSGDGCSSTCQLEQPSTGGGRKVASDYNGDGRSDILWRNSSTGADVIWLTANAATSQSTTGVTALEWKIVGKGDFNGDGKADVVWRNGGNGTNAIWLSGNAATRLVVATVSDQAWQIVGVGDFDHDGKADLLWRNSITGSDSIWRSGNSATRLAITNVTTAAWKVVGVGDFNGDGSSDIFWRNTSTGSNAVWLSANAATMLATTGVTDQHWGVVGIGDFDGDGKSDLLWRDDQTGSNAIWRSANAATRIAVTGVTSQQWQVAAVGDYDGDGKSDILWRNGSSGADVIWKSGNSATQQAVTAVTSLAWKIVPHEGQPLPPPGSP
jgi:cysteine-rich repeat protein